MKVDSRKFDAMRKELEKFDKDREKAIEQSRKVIQLSKQVIYAVQRDGLHEAEKKSVLLKEAVAKLPAAFVDTGMVTAARQEYAEAMTFLQVIKSDVLPSAQDLGLSSYEYLLGICDLTGELMRKAINYVIKEKTEKAEKLRDVVDEIYHQFLKFNLRNGELRKKSDQIKWNLEKLDNVMYDLKVKRN